LLTQLSLSPVLMSWRTPADPFMVRLHGRS